MTPEAIIERMRGDDPDVAVPWLRERLLDGSTARVPSITTRLPFPYHWVPGPVRMRVMDWLFARTLNRVRTGQAFPGLYGENGLDAVASRFRPARETAWRWPGGHGCALVVSHDTDTCGEAAEVRRLAAMARELDIRSTLMVVGQCLDRYRDLVGELRREGFEVGLHDVVHDNRIAFLDEREMRARLEPLLAEWRRDGPLQGFRSPSWYISSTLWKVLEELGFAYDCSVQDTHFSHDPGRMMGAATYYPFLVGTLVVLPNTIAFELPRSLDVGWAEVPGFWRSKVDHVAGTGGLIMINAHPAPWFCGSPEGVAALRACVADILERHQPWCATAAEVAAHACGQAAQGAMAVLPGDPAVTIPSHARSIPAASPDPNPLLTE